MAKKITKVSTTKMSKGEWLSARRRGVGGSDVAAILGLNKYKSQLSLYLEKIGRINDNDYDNEAMLQGRLIEDVVAQRFSMASGLKVRKANNIFTNADYPHALANVDRLIVGENAGLECKTVNAYGSKNYTSDSFNPSYYCQCVHYMAVLGYERWYLAVMVLGVDFKVYMLTTKENDTCPEWCDSMTYVSQEEIDTMKNAVADFWGYVERIEEPPIIGNALDNKALSKLFPYSNEGTETDLTGYTKELDRLSQLTEQAKEIDEEIKGLQAVVKDVLKDNEKGFTDDYKVVWKTQTRDNLDINRLLTEHPEIKANQYIKSTSSRVFRFSKIKK